MRHRANLIRLRFPFYSVRGLQQPSSFCFWGCKISRSHISRIWSQALLKNRKFVAQNNSGVWRDLNRGPEMKNITKWAFFHSASRPAAPAMFYVFPLWTKQVEDFIKNGHKKISATHIRSGYDVPIFFFLGKVCLGQGPRAKKTLIWQGISLKIET